MPENQKPDHQINQRKFLITQAGVDGLLMSDSANDDLEGALSA